MSSTINICNNSVAYLILLLSAPCYGTTDAFKNPAPEPSLVQKHKCILFGSAYFLEHFGVVRPEDAGFDWSALTASPNPFNNSAVKKGALLSDANRAIIAEGSIGSMKMPLLLRRKTLLPNGCHHNSDNLIVPHLHWPGVPS